MGDLQVLDVIKRADPNSDKEYARVIAEYEKYKSGEASYQDWQIFMIGFMDNYSAWLIKHKKRTLGAEYEDLMQAGRESVLRQLPKYDPYKAKPSSYFHNYINQGHKDELYNPLMSKYYVGVAAKLEKIAKENGYKEGLLDPNLRADTLHVISGESLSTVVKILEMKRQSVCSIETVGDIENEMGSYENPERQIISRGRDDAINEVLKQCSKFEIWLLSKRVFADKPSSYRALFRELKDKTLCDELEITEEDRERMSTGLLHQKTSTALRKIKNSPSLRHHIDNVIYQADYELLEQADDDDIYDMMLNSIEDI